jgi:hypothetical protein
MGFEAIHPVKPSRIALAVLAFLLAAVVLLATGCGMDVSCVCFFGAG